MFFATATTLLGLAALAAIPARGAVFNVTIGGPGILRYDPPFVTAEVGDQIVFTFKQKNHTITQSTFTNPCSPAPGGFDSGFKPVADDQTDNFPTQTVTIGDTSPIWIYCRQTGHCQQGMVFAVNGGDKFDAFQAAANASGSSTTSAAASSITQDAPSTTPSVVTVTETLTVGDGSAVTTTYGSYPGSAAPTNAGSTNHLVVVGGADLVYNPSNITAQPGDTITFQFMIKNHTATQSSFAQPCRALALTSTSGQVGFDSGFMPVSANATDFPTYSITVNDTAPIWVYCRQTGHCGQGMVFSANAIESGPNNFAAFKAHAIQLNGTSTSSTGTATSTATGSSSSSTSGALPVRSFSGASAALAAVALVFGFLL